MKDVWYTIFNPASGIGKKKERKSSIQKTLSAYQLAHEFICTAYPHHEEILVQKAIEKGYRKFICIGGDGTLHYMVNGIMKQTIVPSNVITIAVIPSGTGNDWVKTYGISSKPNRAIQTITKNHTIYQDIGKISLKNTKEDIYFVNTAGIGFDAFVVKNIDTYENWGSFTYIVAALAALNSYKPSKFILKTSKKIVKSNMFLISIGLCKYSGSGMQLTHYDRHKSGYFDITLISKIKRRTVLRHILKLYFGGINKLKESQCFRENHINIEKNTTSFIQADGELIGSGDLIIRLIPNAIRFIIS